MTKVHAMPNAILDGEVNKRAVNLLEKLLEEAKRGEIVDFAYVATDPSVGVSYGWVEPMKPMTVLGGLTYVATAFSASVLGDPDD